MGQGNGQMVGGRHHCIMVRSFDFILLLLYGRIYSIYIGTASTLCCRRANIIITIGLNTVQQVGFQRNCGVGDAYAILRSRRTRVLLRVSLLKEFYMMIHLSPNRKIEKHGGCGTRCTKIPWSLGIKTKVLRKKTWTRSSAS